MNSQLIYLIINIFEIQNLKGALSAMSQGLASLSGKNPSYGSYGNFLANKVKGLASYSDAGFAGEKSDAASYYLLIPEAPFRDVSGRPFLATKIGRKITRNRNAMICICLGNYE